MCIAVDKIQRNGHYQYWIDIQKQKPELGQTVLIFTQGYTFVVGRPYHTNYRLGTYVKDCGDRRKKCFVDPMQIDRITHQPESTAWKFNWVTHWIPLPGFAPQIALEEFDQRFGKKR